LSGATYQVQLLRGSPVHISIVSRFSRTVLADTDLTRTPHITHDQGERAEFANGSAIARNRALVKPASNAAELCGIAHLHPGNAVVEIQGLRSYLYDLSKCIAIRCKTQSYPASPPNFAYVRPVIDAGTFVAEFRLSERAPALVRTNEASGEITRWT
jgi:hypothetical protein